MVDLEAFHRAGRTYQRAWRENDDDIDEKREALHRAAQEFYEKPAPPEPTCSFCGKKESETDYGFLTDVTVELAEGEEGHAKAFRLACDDDLITVIEGLMELGFVVHYHGSTNLLEPPDCPGTIGHPRECPTPAGRTPEDEIPEWD